MEPDVDQTGLEKTATRSELSEARDTNETNYSSSTVKYACENFSDIQNKNAQTTSFEELSRTIGKHCHSISEGKCNELLLVLKNNALHIENFYTQIHNCATIRKHLARIK